MIASAVARTGLGGSSRGEPHRRIVDVVKTLLPPPVQYGNCQYHMRLLSCFRVDANADPYMERDCAHRGRSLKQRLRIPTQTRLAQTQFTNAALDCIVASRGFDLAGLALGAL